MSTSRHILPVAFFLLMAFACPFFYGACRKAAPPEPYVRSIELEAVDASCTEAWLRVRFTDSSTPRSFSIVRDSQTVLTALNAPLDSLIVDEGLLPNRTYTYRAYRFTPTSSGLADSSTLVTVTTMDTTSHSFSFEIDTLGDGASSVLYDVAIINDTLVYAAGEIYLRDSLGNWDPQAYNMAKWNGQRWELMRIQFYTICGQSSRTSYPASSIFAFGATDIWVTSRGGQLARWDGTTQTATICNPDPFVINKIWGENPNSIWAVGYGGRIGNYANGTWQRVESGTTAAIQDIWGDAQEILAIASNVLSFPREKKLLRIEGTNVTVISDSGLTLDLSSIWHVSARRYYIVGDGTFWKKNLSENVWHGGPNTITNYYENVVIGTSFNNMFVAGAFGEFLHFNGVRWMSFRSQTGLINGQYYSLAATGNYVVAVGQEYPRAVVLQGTRSP